MNKFISSIAFIFLVAPLHAGFTPGHYEIQDVGGFPIGDLTVTASTATYDNIPATRFDWTFTYSSRNKVVEHHEAYVSNKGLLYFKQTVTDDKGAMTAESQRDNQNLNLFVNDHGRKLSTAVPLKTMDLSEYEIEMPSSPFFWLKLHDARSSSIFVVNALAAVPTRRNINELTAMAYRGKQMDVFVISTNFNNNVVTSWITADTHVLLKERWIDRQFIRLEK